MTGEDWASEGEGKEEWIKKNKKRSNRGGRRINLKAVRVEKQNSFHLYNTSQRFKNKEP